MSMARDFWSFFRERKKWWLLPMFLILLLIGFLVAFTGSAISPFIYTLF